MSIPIITHADLGSNLQLDSEICAQNPADAKFGLRSCAELKTKLTDQAKQDARNYLYFYKNQKRILGINNYYGLCKVHSDPIGNIKEYPQDVNTNNYYCLGGGTCQNENGWTNGLRIKSIKKSYLDVKTEIAAESIHISTTCLPYQNEINKIINGDPNYKYHEKLKVVRAQIKQMGRDFSTASYSDLTAMCSGTYELKDSFQSGNKVGMTGKNSAGQNTDRSTSMCHLVFAQMQIERALQSLVRCEVVDRSNDENFKQIYYSQNFNLDKIRSQNVLNAFSNVMNAPSKSSMINTYISATQHTYDTAIHKINTSSVDSDFANITHLEGWLDEHNNARTDLNFCDDTHNQNTTQNIPVNQSNSVLSLLTGLMMIRRKKPVYLKSKYKLLFTFLFSILILIAPKISQAGGWSASPLEDYGTINQNVTCGNKTLVAPTTCEDDHYTGSHHYAYWRNKYNNCINNTLGMGYEVCKQRKRRALSRYSDYAQCAANQIKKLNDQCNNGPPNPTPDVGNITDISSNGIDSAHEAAELTGNQEGMLVDNQNPNSPKFDAKTSEATAGDKIASKTNSKSSKSNEYKSALAPTTDGLLGAGMSQGGGVGPAFKPNMGQDDKKENVETFAEKKVKSEDNTEFASANKNAQGSLMHASGLSGNDVDLNDVGGAAAIELGGRAPGSLSGDEEFDDYLKRVGSLSLFERIHPHKVKLSKTIMLNNMKMKFQQMRP